MGHYCMTEPSGSSGCGGGSLSTRVYQVCAAASSSFSAGGERDALRAGSIVACAPPCNANRRPTIWPGWPLATICLNVLSLSFARGLDPDAGRPAVLRLERAVSNLRGSKARSRPSPATIIGNGAPLTACRGTAGCPHPPMLQCCSTPIRRIGPLGLPMELLALRTRTPRRRSRSPDG